MIQFNWVKTYEEDSEDFIWTRLSDSSMKTIFCKVDSQQSTHQNELNNSLALYIKKRALKN